MPKILINYKVCDKAAECAFPSACPVGAIMYADADAQEAEIEKLIASDPHTEDWLWQERYGVFPGTFGLKLLDLCHPDCVDYRLHFPLFSGLTQGSGIKVYKLNARSHPSLAARLEVSPLLLRGPKTLETISGYIQADNLTAIIQTISNYSKN